MANYTDEQIKAALVKIRYGGHSCDKCKFKISTGDERCGLKGCYICRLALDLINRQEAEKKALIAGQETLQKYLAEKEAEIERLKRILDSYALQYGTVVDKDVLLKRTKSEAIKEFAELVKKHQVMLFNEIYSRDGFSQAIDNLVKEMVGESNA